MPMDNRSHVRESGLFGLNALEVKNKEKVAIPEASAKKWSENKVTFSTSFPKKIVEP